MTHPVKIFIGWDSREPIAADVCEYSIQKNSTMPVDIQMLKQELLREQMLYARPRDTQGSTEFTFTRFLVPRLMDYKGWAVFCDCDFLWLGDIKDLIDQADDQYAVMLVKHDYRPQNTIKMDGKRQEYYPRKNWSSMMLFNCGHAKNKWLTPYHINRATGQELHRFSWLDDKDIGSISPEWNWLVGWYHQPWDGVPKALHYTEGGPWFKNYEDCEYADVWLDYESRLRDTHVSHDVLAIKDLHLPESTKGLLQAVLDHVQDPWQQFGSRVHENTLKQMISDYKKDQIIGLSEGDDLTKKAQAKGARWDGIVHAFVQGASGCMASWDMAENLTAPIALRSIAKKKIMHHCLEQGRDFYYIDTGYFGNRKLKDYHRVTRNAMQWLGPIEDRPADRLDRTRIQPRPITAGSKILIAPPSHKAMSYWGLDPDQWVQETVDTLKKHTDRPIVIRMKQSREIRATVDTMEMALRDDVHALVTFNSIAAIEGLIYGKPVFTMGPNAAQPLANTDLSQIENPFCPDLDQVRALLRCLAYHQFTVEEMSTGYAWAVLQGQA
jgi:lipopolysaccharide biosynthesis glycosyltransferase